MNSVGSLIATVAVGTLAYSLIEEWPVFAALYLTISYLLRFNHVIIGAQPAINQLEKLAAGYQS